MNQEHICAPLLAFYFPGSQTNGCGLQARAVYSAAVFEKVVEQYAVLEAAVHGSKGLASSTEEVRLQQPWEVQEDPALVS